MITYRIVRRAYGKYTEVETVDGWMNAMNRSMALEYANKDGEYLLREVGEPDWTPPEHCPVQARWAYL